MKQSALKETILDKSQLMAYFSSAAVPRAQWRTGMECEIFTVRQDSLLPIPFYGEQGTEVILKQMAEQFGWSPVFEGQAVIGLKKNGYTITLEPGGQIELSGSPQSLIKECIKERTDFIDQLKEITLPMGIRLMTIGYHPLASLEDVSWVPKKRYQAMSEYFLQRGGHLAHHMMQLTTSVQTSIDYADEEDFSCKLMLASYLTPILQAIYANSPLKKGQFSGDLDFRGTCWEHTDKDRCGLFPKAFSGDFGFEDYTDFLLSMPMIVRFSGQEPIPMEGMLFQDYWESHSLTMEDWDSHVSFAFPEIRLRNYIELRMFDSIPDYLMPTIPALLKGLLYDQATRKTLGEIFKQVSGEEVIRAYREVHEKALQSSFAGQPILEVAKEIVSLGEQGLASLGREGILSSPEELSFLDPLKEQLWGKGMSPAEELMQLWEEKGRDLFKLKDRFLL